MKKFTLLLCFMIGYTYAAWSQNGSLDLSFGSNGTVLSPINNGDSYHDVVVQSDNKIVAVGMSFDALYVSRANVFRFMPDGSPDTDFGVDGVFTYELNFEANIYSCVINSSGKIILAGSTTDYVNYNFLIIQLNTDGTLDTSFGVDGVVLYNACPQQDGYYENQGAAVILDANENILISGNAFDENYARRPVVVRFSPSGDIDSTFGENGVATIPIIEGACSYECLALQPDGKIIAGGYFGNTLWWYVLLLTRFNEDGTLDTSFGDNGVVKHSHGDVDDEAFEVAIAENGNIVVAGFTATATYNFSTLVMQFTPSGEVDSTFGSDGAIVSDLANYDVADAVSILADGKIVVAGTSGEGPPNSYHMAIWKYNADGTPDNSFDSDGFVQHELENYYTMGYGLAIQNDGKILIAGQARTNGNQNHYFLSRLENDIQISIQEKGPITLNLYPNPCSTGSMIRLDGYTQNVVAIHIYNSNGALIHTVPGIQNVAYGKSFFLPAHLTAGVYTVSTIDDQGTRRHQQLVITN